MKRNGRKDSLEKLSKKRRGRMNLENVILSTLAVTGIVTFAAMAPNAVRLLKHVDMDWISKRDPRQRLHECMSRMRRKGLVKFNERTRRYELSDSGTRRAEEIDVGTAKISAPLRWDRRWRIVMFDISEKRKPLRRSIARLISRLGFYRLQDSVWVHPYDCEEIIALLKLKKGVGLELRYVIADAIEYDKPIREHFDLPLQ